MMGRLRNLWRRKSLQADIEEELGTHLEFAAEDAVRDGMAAEEARRVARLRFGNPAVIREQTQEADAALWLEGLLRDIKFALRQMKHSPGFSAIAVLTLALGIGGITSVFTLVQQVMLRMLPATNPQQLWVIGDYSGCCMSSGYTQSNGTFQNDWTFFSWEAYQLFRGHTPAFGQLAAFQIGEGNAELAVRRGGSRSPAESRNGEYVSGNFFQTLGIAAWRGRLFTEADDQQGAPSVAVMSYHAWQEQYGSDPSVVGSSFAFNGHPFTVVGITPPNFYGAKVSMGDMPDFWMPLATEPMMAGPASRLKNPAAAWLDLIGRVRPGTSPKTLQAQLQGELQEWLASHAGDMTAQEKADWPKQTLHLTPGGAGVSLLRHNYGRGLWLLLAAAGCVLLLACANLANLLLARGLRNRQQIALRMALGAPRWHLVRKALVESTMLALSGGAAGIAVAYAGARLILHLTDIRSPQASWIPVQPSPSAAVLLFALGISLVTGIIFGLAPAWMTTHADPMEAMKCRNRAMAGNAYRMQKSLVALQCTASLVLLTTAALLGQSLRNLVHQDFGFNPEGRYLVSIDPRLSNFSQDQLPLLFQQIDTGIAAIPGVRAVGGVQEAPPGGWLSQTIRIEGRPEAAPAAAFLSMWTRVTPGYFAAMGNRILIGRQFTTADNQDTRPVAIVSASFAKRFFGRANPIGQHFGLRGEKNSGIYEVVGVTSDVEFGNQPGLPVYYLPEAQTTQFGDSEAERREVWSHDLYNLVIWAPGNQPALETRVRKLLTQIAPNLMLYGMKPYSETIRDSFAQQTMMATLTLLFGVLGMSLAAVGLHGVTAYGVEQRAREIGIRMALGADRFAVVILVMREAFVPVAIGLAAGIPGSLAIGTCLAHRLFQVAPWDPPLLTGATFILAAAAVMAAIFAAVRATRVDPAEVMRSE